MALSREKSDKTRIEHLLSFPYGMQGADLITNADTYTGNWYMIMAIAESTVLDISACTVNWAENAGALSTDITLPVGVPLYGNWTSIDISGGQLIAYRQ